MESINSASEAQEQQISLLDSSKRYPAVNPTLLENNLDPTPQQKTDLPQPGVELSVSLQQLRHWYKAAQILGKDERYLNRITELAGEVATGHQLPYKAQVAMEHDLALFQAPQSKASRSGPPTPVLQQSSVTLDSLRSWYASARELNKDAAYLHWITAIAQAFKYGKLLSAKELAAMQQDIQAYRQLG